MVYVGGASSVCGVISFGVVRAVLCDTRKERGFSREGGRQVRWRFSACWNGVLYTWSEVQEARVLYYCTAVVYISSDVM